ncbi:MAG: NifB/NifX family molybdenum-iron cluster-binding protein [Candidatus Alcyoniella australis]|nr:NifB/NifX family molybdenum-iron cluster-binding protein [Candidatus Alcyoniella australis]
MKLLITSVGESLDSEVDPRFGRARCMILYDTDSGEHKVLGNEQNLHAMQGAGVQAGQSVVTSGAEAVLTGNCGPKAFAVLSSAGIKIYSGATGTVRQAIEDFKAGKYQPSSDANVTGHWV